RAVRNGQYFVRTSHFGSLSPLSSNNVFTKKRVGNRDTPKEFTGFFRVTIVALGAITGIRPWISGKFNPSRVLH
ncbi:MAG: hypothetical protein KJO30_04690, partial [Boseongicola sp.]|nr:hypothetical protein [Boseongicola sp.]